MPSVKGFSSPFSFKESQLDCFIFYFWCGNFKSRLTAVILQNGDNDKSSRQSFSSRLHCKYLNSLRCLLVQRVYILFCISARCLSSVPLILRFLCHDVYEEDPGACEVSRFHEDYLMSDAHVSSIIKNIGKQRYARRLISQCQSVVFQLPESLIRFSSASYLINYKHFKMFLAPSELPLISHIKYLRFNKRKSSRK